MGFSYDLLSWTSFPSSLKIANDTEEVIYVWHEVVRDISVKPGSKLTVQCNTKQTGRATLPPYPHGSISAGIRIDLYNPAPFDTHRFLQGAPFGTFDWRTNSVVQTVPADATVILVRIYALGKKGDIIWFDDLKIYQDDVLIYSNDFAKWDPYIGAGLGAGVLGVVVPAVVRVPEPGVAYEYQKPYLEKEPLLAAGLAGLGALVGGGIGLLTGLGIIPVPQIPALGAAPEEPGAPARLGKYLITG